MRPPVGGPDARNMTRNTVAGSPVSSGRPGVDAYFERLLPFGLVLSPPAGVALAVGLTVLRRARFARLGSQREAVLVAGGLAALGAASALASVSLSRAGQGLVAMAALWWLWAVGRCAVDDGSAFTTRMERATALVGLLALMVAFGRVELRVSLPFLGSLTLAGPENKGTVLGLGGNGLGPLLVFSAMLGLGRVARCSSWADRAEGLAVGGVNLAAVLALGVRNALWGGGVGSVALMLATGPVALGVTLVVALALVRARPELLSRWVELLDWSTEQPRWGAWEAAWRMLRDRPWLGVRPDQFALVHPAYALPQSAHLTDPHNMYLKLASEWGVPAALLFFGWILRELTFAWRLRTQSYRWALGAGVLAFLAMGVFDTPLFTLHVSGPVLVGLGVAGALPRDGEPDP